MKAVLQRIQTNRINHFIDKCKHQQQPRFFLRNSTCTHIEQRIFIKLSHCRSVRTLHVVRINLQLGLCIHPRITGGAKITVGLLGTCMLRIRTHQYQPGKSTYRLIIEHVFKQLITRTVGHCMVNTRVVIHMLVLISDSHAAKIYFSSLACQQHFGCITGCTVMQRHAIQMYIAVRFLLHIQVAETHRAGMRLFQLIHIEYHILSGKNLNHLRCQEIHVIHCMVAKQ